ncbi:putative epoxide hydrolase [Talaromyces pinophilus]|nr:putative epoxide hydrolase [Talaromyces pinophilus]
MIPHSHLQIPHHFFLCVLKMTSITPFKVSISDERIERLHQKLALAELPFEVPDLKDHYSRGVPLSDIKRLALHWQTNFNWRAIEAKINEIPQFTANIAVEGFGTYDIHFVHQRSEVPNAIPLLVLHGWPSSFLAVQPMLPLLVDEGIDGPAFHVVAPSLIDFGFSSASKKTGFDIEQHAEACHKLMIALGYNEYVVQGGDIGYLITRFIAMKYGPKHCRAYHLNNAAPAEPSSQADSTGTQLSASDLKGLARTQEFTTGGGNAYYLLQSSKPQTLAYSLTDSPLGLLAWIHEKLISWTDNYPWTDDEILTWVSIYYFSTAGPAACLNLYYEMEHGVDGTAFEKAKRHIGDVPLGVTRFEKDLILLPKAWNATLGPVVWESVSEKGGHFPTWECPEVIVTDLRGMFGKNGKLFDCVEGRNGYVTMDHY